jgi:hypothetical protein
MSNRTPAQAAAEIAALINSRVSSPRVDELELIVGRVQVPATTAAEPVPPLHVAIRDLMPKVQKANGDAIAADAKAIGLGVDLDTYPELIAAREHRDKLEAALKKLIEELWTAPVSSFADVLIQAEVAQHEACDWPAPYGSDGLVDPVAYSREAFGRLTMAVLTMDGRRFSAHGYQADAGEEA